MPRLALVLALALTAFVSGCGGADVAYTEVKSAPEGLPIPKNVGIISASGTADDAANGNVTTGKTTPAPAPAPATTTDDGVVAVPTEVPTTAPVTPVVPVTPEDTPDDTGAAAPPTTEETVPPSDSGGAVAPGNDQFCADNPGACND